MNDKLEDLYNRVTGEEDARVCKDIPDAACQHQPHNFFSYLIANLLGKIADEITSARLVLPWLFGVLSVPAGFTGFLVPIREAGVLLPQLVVAAAVRHLPIRKGVWLVGAIFSAISLCGMGIAATMLEGSLAGSLIILMLVIYSLARGLCSVSAKDVLGKTVSKSRRGILMGWSAGLSGVAVLAIGLWLGVVDLEDAGLTVFAGLLIGGSLLWLVAVFFFAVIREQPGATEGGGNALIVAVQQLRLLVDDAPFRRFVLARALLLSVALAPPFYVLIAQAKSGAGMLGLGALIIANGLATSFSAPLWGYMGDKSSRGVMAIASAGAGFLGVLTFLAIRLELDWAMNEFGFAAVFLLLNIMHGGVRLGRKVYLVDMATGGNRAAYVAVSNTVIGVLMLAGGLIGLVASWLGTTAIVLILGLLSLVAAGYITTIPDVSASK